MTRWCPSGAAQLYANAGLRRRKEAAHGLQGLRVGHTGITGQVCQGTGLTLGRRLPCCHRPCPALGPVPVPAPYPGPGLLLGPCLDLCLRNCLGLQCLVPQQPAGLQARRGKAAGSVAGSKQMTWPACCRTASAAPAAGAGGGGSPGGGLGPGTKLPGGGPKPGGTGGGRPGGGPGPAGRGCALCCGRREPKAVGRPCTLREAGSGPGCPGGGLGGAMCACGGSRPWPARAAGACAAWLGARLRCSAAIGSLQLTQSVRLQSGSTASLQLKATCRKRSGWGHWPELRAVFHLPED